MGFPPVFNTTGLATAGLQSFLANSLLSTTSITGTVSLVFDHPADKLIGTDISLDGTGTTYTINTTGIYSIWMGLAWTATSADTVKVATQFAGLSSNAPFSVEGFFDQQFPLLAGAATANTHRWWVLPSMWFNSGAQFVVNMSSIVGAGNASCTNCDIIISRIT